MTVNDYFQRFGVNRSDVVERICCKDGFSISVQASQYHYCEPRESNAERYVCVEVGYPSKSVRSFARYAERQGRKHTGIYAYVPIEEVDAVIRRHGGIVN